MIEFKEGQEVEVYDDPKRHSFRKAKIVQKMINLSSDPNMVQYEVVLQGGQHHVFDADVIRLREVTLDCSMHSRP